MFGFWPRAENMKVMIIAVVGDVFRMVPKEPRGTRNQRKNQDHARHSIVKIGLEISHLFTPN